MKWIYLYQDMNDVCKYVSSEKPDEWQTMMYYDFLVFLVNLKIEDRDKFMFYFSFIGKIVYIDLLSGAWEEVSLDVDVTFNELLELNQKEEENKFSLNDYLRENYTKVFNNVKEYIHDKSNNFKF